MTASRERVSITRALDQACTLSPHRQVKRGTVENVDHSRDSGLRNSARETIGTFEAWRNARRAPSWTRRSGRDRQRRRGTPPRPRRRSTCEQTQTACVSRQPDMHAPAVVPGRQAGLWVAGRQGCVHLLGPDLARNSVPAQIERPEFDVADRQLLHRCGAARARGCTNCQEAIGTAGWRPRLPGQLLMARQQGRRCRLTA